MTGPIHKLQAQRQLQSSLEEYEWVQEGTKWVKRLTPAAAEAKRKAEEEAEAELREAQRLEIEAHRAAMQQVSPDAVCNRTLVANRRTLVNIAASPRCADF